MVTDDLKTSSVFAGGGADTFSLRSATSSYVAGNKGADSIHISGGLLATSIYGAGAAITTDVATTPSTSPLRSHLLHSGQRWQ